MYFCVQFLVYHGGAKNPCIHAIETRHCVIQGVERSFFNKQVLMKNCRNSTIGHPFIRQEAVVD